MGIDPRSSSFSGDAVDPTGCGPTHRPRIARPQLHYHDHAIRALRAESRLAIDPRGSAVRATGTRRGRQTGDSKRRRSDHENFCSCKSFGINAWEGNRTPTPLAGLRILSPVRLPVPPPRRIAKSMLTLSSYSVLFQFFLT